MSRYIDADKMQANLDELKYVLTEHRYSWITSLIKMQPTADVVEVVRCKDCKHLEIINSREVYAKCRMTDLEFKPFDIDTRKHYCSYGERRENEP